MLQVMPCSLSSRWNCSLVYSICRFATASDLLKAASSLRSAAPATLTTMLAESYGLYKAEDIHPRGPWRNVDAVEFATLEWVDWFNNRRLLEPIGDIPPVEFE